MISQNLLWAIGLMILAGVFVILEFLIPSAGLLGIGAVMAAIAALVLAFMESTTAGLTMTGVLAIGTPVLFMAAIRFWPYTPIGRRILNLPPIRDEDDSLDEGVDGPRSSGVWEPENRYKHLLGKVGTARTDLLPSGQVEIEGKKYDAVALGMAVDRGQYVEVASVDAGRVRVKLTSRRPANLEDFRASNPEVGDDWEADLVNRPIEDFDLEDLR